MFKKLFKLYAIILLMLGGFYLSATAKSSHLTKSCHQKHASFATEQSHTPVEQLANATGIPVQLSRIQRSRTVHYIHYLTVRYQESVTYINYLDFTCGRYSSEFSNFRKLIIFPFHVFW